MQKNLVKRGEKRVEETSREIGENRKINGNERGELLQQTGRQTSRLIINNEQSLHIVIGRETSGTQATKQSHRLTRDKNTLPLWGASWAVS